MTEIGRVIRAVPGLAGPPGRAASFSLLAAATLPADLATVPVTTNPALLDGELLFVVVRGAQCWLSRSGGTTTLRRHLPVQDPANLLAGESLTVQDYNYGSFPLAATVVIPSGSGGGTVQITLPASVMPTQNAIYKVQIKGITGLLTKIVGPTAFSFVPDASLLSPINLVATIDFFVLTASTITIPPTAATPSWLPVANSVTANLHCDFINDYYWWGGQIQPKSALTPKASGFTLDGYADWWDAANGATVVVEVDNGQLLAAPEGVMFSSLSAAGQRIDLSAQPVGPTPSGAVRTGLSGYTSTVSPANFFAPSNVNYRGRGIHRYVLSFRSGQPGLVMADNMDREVVGLGNWTVEVPNRLGFGNWHLSDLPLTNAILRSVTIYKGQATQAFMDAAVLAGALPPLHAVGDSFLTGDHIIEEIALLANAKYKKYLPTSHDNAGGRSLAEVATLAAAYPSTPKAKWLNAWRMHMDGGRSDTWQVALASISKYGALQTEAWRHKYLVMESSPTDIVNGPGDVNWDAWFDHHARIVARLGPHHVPTHLPAMSWSDGTPADVAQVDKLLWPQSLISSPSDFHPNDKGNRMLGLQAFLALERLGYFNA